MKNLKWKPTITIDDGINDVENWIRDNYKSLIKSKLKYHHKK